MKGTIMFNRKSQRSYDNAALLMEWEAMFFATLFAIEMRTKN